MKKWLITITTDKNETKTQYVTTHNELEYASVKRVVEYVNAFWGKKAKMEEINEYI